MLGVADGVAAWAEQVMNRRILSFFCRVHVCGLDLFVNFCRPGVNYPCLGMHSRFRKHCFCRLLAPVWCVFMLKREACEENKLSKTFLTPLLNIFEDDENSEACLDRKCAYKHTYIQAHTDIYMCTLHRFPKQET